MTRSSVLEDVRPGAALAVSTGLVSSGVRRWRGVLTVALGGLWLLDGALQFQPYMYSSHFPAMLAQTAQGSPSWISGPVSWSAALLGGHLTVLNTLFALTQVALGLGLILRRTRRPALAASVVWGLLVWWLGEAMGGVFAGPVTPFMGLPGAALLYVLAALLVWPTSNHAAASVASASPLTAIGAKVTWFALWALFAWETLRPANLSPSALHDMVVGMANGEPHWLQAIDNAAGGLLDHHGAAASLVLAALYALVAVAVLVPPRYGRPLLGLAVLMATIVWVIGENFGALATGNATDPNSGPLLILLAACFWPHGRATHVDHVDQPV